MSFDFGETLKIEIYGSSHGRCVGAVIRGLPAGLVCDAERIAQMLRRRAPGRGEYATARREADEPQVLSGVRGGVLTGEAVRVEIANTDVRGGDYDELRGVPRPGHADLPAYAKYGADADLRGGGRFSGRMTAPLVFAGALCLPLLESRGIRLGSHLLAIGGVRETGFDPVGLDAATLRRLAQMDFPVLDAAAGERMRAEIAAAASAGDSVGGVVECAATGLPCGAGETLFSSLESRIAAAVFAVPGVRGVEFGAGFAAAAMRGSENNDEYYFDGGGRVRSRTNHHGGVLGGLATGMPLIFRAALKPTPSIAREQRTVDLKSGGERPLSVRGRHDPCIAPRAAVCCEAALALALTDMLLSEK